MRRRQLKICIVTIFATVLISLGADAQGLKFTGMEKPINDRTSLEIGLKSAAKAKDSLVVSFDFMLMPQAKSGYYFRLKTSVAENAPTVSLFCNWNVNPCKFHVVWEKRRFISTLDVPVEDLYNEGGRWARACLKVYPRKDSVSFSVDEKWTTGGLVDLPDKLKPFLSFGRNDYVNDVPSFALKNLRLQADGKSLLFPLDEDSGNLALSNKSYVMGRVSNPVWLASNHATWQKISGPSWTKGIACMGYDSKRHEVWSFNRDSIYFRKATDGSCRSKVFMTPCPVPDVIGTAFMNPDGGDIYSYEICYIPDHPLSATTAVLDTATLKWTQLSSSIIKTHLHLHHHDQYVDTARGRYIIFGGFGYMKFCGDFYSMDLDGGRWSTITPTEGDRIWPRFFSALGEDPNTGLLYVFGGMGNESGEQVVGRQYMYDLYEVDLDRGLSRKLWTADWKEGNCVMSRDLVLDGEGNFYVLAYPESRSNSSFNLYRFSMKDGSYEKLANTLPIYSDRITTHANLYYDKALEKLICTVEESLEDVDSHSSIYSISFPPKAIGRSTVEIVKQRRIVAYATGGLLLLLLLAWFGTWALRRLRFRARIPDTALMHLPPKPNSIRLFGDFSAIDREGNDFSSLFTGKLRQLLCLILQYNESGGISSKQLSAMMWPYKEEEKAKNIRGVTISALRKLLSRMDGVSLEHEAGRFRLNCSSPFSCDFLEFTKILDSDWPDMDRLIRILSRGKFLSVETDPIFDKLKDIVEQKVEVVMSAEINRRFMLHQYRNTIICAEIIFTIDPLDENALSYMLRAMTLLNQKEEAQARYRDFVLRYKKDYNEEYEHSFASIIGGTFHNTSDKA